MRAPLISLICLLFSAYAFGDIGVKDSKGLLHWGKDFEPVNKENTVCPKLSPKSTKILATQGKIGIIHDKYTYHLDPVYDNKYNIDSKVLNYRRYKDIISKTPVKFLSRSFGKDKKKSLYTLCLYKAQIAGLELSEIGALEYSHDTLTIKLFASRLPPKRLSVEALLIAPIKTLPRRSPRIPSSASVLEVKKYVLDGERYIIQRVADYIAKEALGKCIRFIKEMNQKIPSLPTTSRPKWYKGYYIDQDEGRKIIDKVNLSTSDSVIDANKMIKSIQQAANSNEIMTQFEKSYLIINLMVKNCRDRSILFIKHYYNQKSTLSKRIAIELEPTIKKGQKKWKFPKLRKWSTRKKSIIIHPGHW